MFSAARRGITTIKESVQIDFLSTAFSGHFYHRHDVIFVAVYAASREQTHDVYRFAAIFCLVDRIGQHRVSEESTLFNFNIQTGKVLIHDAARAQVDVTHFGVAHLAIGQANFQARRINQGMRTFCPQRIHYRGFSTKNGVILAVFAIAVAIQNHQYHRFFRNRHCDNLTLNR